jgi:hypothetical protein
VRFASFDILDVVFRGNGDAMQAVSSGPMAGLSMEAMCDVESLRQLQQAAIKGP